jgi:hypothetical protein
MKRLERPTVQVRPEPAHAPRRLARKRVRRNQRWTSPPSADDALPAGSPGPRDAGDQVRRKKAAATEQLALELLDDPDVLARVEDAMRANGYVGDLTPALLAYVALTSRVMERPMNLAFVANPSAGKNAMIDAALALMPPEAYYEFSAASPTSIIYTSGHFKHRVVLFREADSIPDDGSAASAVRALAEDNTLQYEVTGVNPNTGKFETRKITKPGPTRLITTSMRGLRPQLNSRVLQVPLVDDAKATREVMRAKGKQAAGNGPSPPNKEPFLALQRWLAARLPHRVIVPFGEVLADQMPGALELSHAPRFRKATDLREDDRAASATSPRDDAGRCDNCHPRRL